MEGKLFLLEQFNDAILVKKEKMEDLENRLEIVLRNIKYYKNSIVRLKEEAKLIKYLIEKELEEDE